jgi:hypothetical protein
MTSVRRTTKAELLADSERNWTALNAALERLTEAQLTTIRDAQGWSVKDHIVHLTAWERSMVYLLRGQPRHLGLGVEEALYVTGDDDAINAAIEARHRDLPSAAALHAFRSVHAQLLTAIEPLSDTDLHERYRHYLPDSPGDDDGPVVFDLLYGNTAHHFAEHLGWIESLVGESL